MQLQVKVEDIEYYINRKVLIGVQYHNPIERALRRDLNLGSEVTVAAYCNQATITWPPANKDSKARSIVVNYSFHWGEGILFLVKVGQEGTKEQFEFQLKYYGTKLSTDLCPTPTRIIYKNILPKSHLKDYYKYCED